MHKCRFVCIFASLYTLAQGCVHLALILWYKHTLFIKFHKCIYPDSITIYMFVYINYFYDNECLVWQYFIKQANHSSVVYEIDNVSPFELHKQPYTILDVFWLITSILLFVAALSKRSTIAKLIFHIPWISMTFVINIFDIYEIFLFLFHLLKCETAQEWLQSIGVKNVHDIFKEFPMIPPTFILVIITRFFVLLLINSTLLYLVTKYYLDAIGKGPRTRENVPTINANYNVFLQNFDTSYSSNASKETGEEQKTNKRVHFAEGTKKASSPNCIYPQSQNLVHFDEAKSNADSGNKEINKNLPWTYFPHNHLLILPKIQKTLIRNEGTDHHQSTKF